MSFTNMVLGGNWDRSEWPDRIEVSHEGAGDQRPYVPERTCRMRDTRWDDGQCTWGCICSECGARREHESGRWLNFCPNCGAKVVEE